MSAMQRDKGRGRRARGGPAGARADRRGRAAPGAPAWGDADLEGVPGWAVEVKRHRTAPPGEVARWWVQAVAQAGGRLPVLLYRADRGQWRAVWPLAVCLVHQAADAWRGIEWTADTTVQAWAAVARELAAGLTASARHARQGPRKAPGRANAARTGPKCFAPCRRGLSVGSASTKERTA